MTTFDLDIQSARRLALPFYLQDLSRSWHYLCDLYRERVLPTVLLPSVDFNTLISASLLALLLLFSFFRTSRKKSPMFSNSTFPNPYANNTSTEANNGQLEEESRVDEVIIEWGNERYAAALQLMWKDAQDDCCNCSMLFRLPDPKTPLIKLKQAIANKTGIEPNQQTLLMHGTLVVQLFD